MKIIVCNAGSTSLKFKLYSFPEEKVLATGKVERIGDIKSIFAYSNFATNYKYQTEDVVVSDYQSGIKLFLDQLLSENGVIKSLDDIDVCGFKTVISKGYSGVFEITEDLKNGMREYLDIAQVHNTCYLQAIDAFEQVIPSAKKVAVFETAFHSTITEEKYTYAIPYKWTEKFGIRKYGYHGASHSYTANLIKSIYGENKKVIQLHLGGSASACATYDGKSVDTSFQMSLQTGLLHANRAGDLDSFIFPMLMNRGLTKDEICQELAKNAGLKGIFEKSGDMRDIEAAYAQGDKRAKLTVDTMVYNIIKFIGSFYIELEGVDVITFAGGIGEKSSLVRKLICDKLAFIGVKLDEKLNEDYKETDGVISAKDSKVIVKIVNIDEEIVVARKSYELLTQNQEEI